MARTDKELVTELTIAYISSWEKYAASKNDRMTLSSVTKVFNTFKTLIESMEKKE